MGCASYWATFSPTHLVTLRLIFCLHSPRKNILAQQALATADSAKN
jgi:hypothetical protein